MYKDATKLQLRFTSSYGALSTEQLWGLSLKELDFLAVDLEKQLENPEKKSFLDTKSKEDKISKLKFDIVIDILNTLVEQADLEAKIQSDKENNQKILGLIAAKQDEDLASMSIEDLKKMLI